MKRGALLSLLLIACGGSTAGVDLTGTLPPGDPGHTTDPTDPPQQDAGHACPAVAYACDPGDVQVSGPDDCKGLTCYSRGTTDECFTQIWCAKNHENTCTAVPTCNDGEKEYQNGCPPGPVGSQCRKVTVCDATIYCYSVKPDLPPKDN